MIIVFFYFAIMLAFSACFVWHSIACHIRYYHVPTLLRGGYQYWQLHRIYHRLSQYRKRYGKLAAKRWQKDILHDCEKQG